MLQAYLRAVLIPPALEPALALMASVGAHEASTLEAARHMVRVDLTAAG